MSIVTKEFYAVACDLCGHVDDGGEYTYWVEEEFAYITAEEIGWKITRFGDNVLVFCDDHMEWSCDTGKVCASCGELGEDTEQLWADNCEDCWEAVVQWRH